MNRIRVLLAEDHPTISRELTRVMRNDPALEIVGEVSDGEGAISLAGQLRPDVVVIDVSLPENNGLVTSEQICRQFSHMAVVLLTEDGSRDYAHAALDHGASVCVEKAAVHSQLIHAIKLVFGGMRLHRPDKKFTPGGH